MDVTLAYRDLQRLVGHFAAWLQADGVGKGDGVAIIPPNALQYASCRGVLKIAVAGGMALERNVTERWQSLSGIPLSEGYGLTEASPVVCGNRFDIGSYTGTIGLPLPSTEVAILDDDGMPLSANEVGARRW